MLPTEIEDAIDALRVAAWLDETPGESEDAIEVGLLVAAILKFGDQRYEEGIEAGRELEQTKGEGM